MATDVILPALGMSQDSGKIVRWLKGEGEQVAPGEPLVEIETDKATVEIEAPAAGFLARIAAAGAEVPVGQVIATILAQGEAIPSGAQMTPAARIKHTGGASAQPGEEAASTQALADLDGSGPQAAAPRSTVVPASPLAARIAAERGIDLSRVKARGRQVRKADVLAYVQGAAQAEAERSRRPAASPKARRLARELGRDLATIRGTGPQGAVLAADVLAVSLPEHAASAPESGPSSAGGQDAGVSTIWRIMAERTMQSWTSAPHFYLTREVDASRLIAWRTTLATRQDMADITYTDLLVKIVATALCQHPHLNATWSAGRVRLLGEINIGLAVAVEEGLVVPVIHRADTLVPSELAHRRRDLVTRARAGKLRPQDVSGGTFTISNLGMYGVDAFNAIINEPQAAILAVGRIAERVVARQGQPAVLPTLVLTLSCDHRAVDGARGAQFLTTIAGLIEEPLNLLEMHS
jgi:pyruvate dehydrogenase E2 component (dihydrolipoamide acetyltransferase)